MIVLVIFSDLKRPEWREIKARVGMDKLTKPRAGWHQIPGHPHGLLFHQSAFFSPASEQSGKSVLSYPLCFFFPQIISVKLHRFKKKEKKKDQSYCDGKGAKDFRDEVCDRHVRRERRGRKCQRGKWWRLKENGGSKEERNGKKVQVSVGAGWWRKLKRG